MTTTKRTRQSDSPSKQPQLKKVRGPQFENEVSDVARKLFDRAVQARVAKQMEQSDSMILSMHRKLRDEKVKNSRLLEEIVKLKSLVARQQIELMRLEEKNNKEQVVEPSVTIDSSFDSIDLDLEKLFNGEF